MANPRKQIILNEIQFWKQNKLLPEHYCDFLMTLYSEGNEEEVEQKNNYKKSVKAREKQRFQLLTSLLVLVAVVLIGLLFVFDQLSVYLLIVVGIFTVISIIGSIYFAKKRGLLAPVFQIIAALFIFSLSVKIGITYFPNQLLVLYSLLIANCLLWLGTGLLSRLIYFTIAGSLGLVILIGYQLFF